MLGWAIWFFIVALVAAVFGFGGIATAFAGIAQLLFWVFIALLVISLVFGFFSGRGGAIGDAGHPVGGHGRSGLAMLAAALVVGVIVYAWTENDWSAEQAGRSIDRAATEISADAGEAVEEAGQRAENLIIDTSESIREDLDETADRADEETN